MAFKKQESLGAWQGGQILLIVILTVIVASTIGLSVATRSITSLRTSTEEAESQKALAAAEAGIERAIQENVLPTGVAVLTLTNNNLGNRAGYSVNIQGSQSSAFLINGGNVIPKDEGADVWLIKHNADDTPDYSSALSPNFLNLYWGSSSDGCNNAAIQAIVVSRNKNTGEIKSYRYAYDGCSSRRTGTNGNNFAPADSGSFAVSGISDVTFGNRTAPQNDLAKNINDVVLIRVVPIYKDTAVAVSACNHNQESESCTSLPVQGYVISSTGTSGQASTKLRVFSGYPQTYLPYLSYGLFVAK